jgi:hypothetical protein
VIAYPWAKKVSGPRDFCYLVAETLAALSAREGTKQARYGKAHIGNFTGNDTRTRMI